MRTTGFALPATAISEVHDFVRGRQSSSNLLPSIAELAVLSIEHTLQRLATLSFPFVIFSEALGETKMRNMPVKCPCGKSE